MLGSAFLISPNFFFFSFFTQRHIFCFTLPAFVFSQAATWRRASKVSSQCPCTQIALAFLCVCSAGVSAKVGRDGWLCLEGNREGEKGTDIQGYSLMGLSWLLFHCVTPFPSPLPLSIRCHLFMGSDEDVCCCCNTCFTNLMNLVVCIRNNKASIEREFSFIYFIIHLFSMGGYLANITLFYLAFVPLLIVLLEFWLRNLDQGTDEI